MKSISTTFTLCVLLSACPVAQAQDSSPKVTSESLSSSGGVTTLKSTYSDGTLKTTTGTRDASGRMTYQTKEAPATYDPSGRGFSDAKRGGGCSTGEC
jgi:hypothetical protein